MTGLHGEQIHKVRRLTLAAPICLFLALFAGQIASAQTFTTLYSFSGVNGDQPYAGVIRDAKGNLFGTTYRGGSYGTGILFKLSETGNEKVLHTFSGNPDGQNPEAPVIRDAAGNLYGTTEVGGSKGFGMVFVVKADGTETDLHDFGGGATDGSYPAGLIRDAAGNLYGMTSNGGSSNLGTIYELDKAGTETVLYSFTGGDDGGEPYAGLVRDAAGNMYGTTSAFGANGKGTVFKLSARGQLSTIYAFTGGVDGGTPVANVTIDSKGNLYSTTTIGGTTGQGTVFKITGKTRKEKVLYSFTGDTDGAMPTGAVVRDSKGQLYGTATKGGANQVGTVFLLAPTGQLTVLHTFTGGTDGATPLYMDLVRDRSGKLYGTTSAGGTSGVGTVFKLVP
jgi:uncharacterized repeat protein (TIGR03803 family)